MTDGVSLVVRAWLDEGRNPAYHRAMKRKLSREWPSLYDAVETLVRERVERERAERDCPCWECQIRGMDESDRNRDFGTSGDTRQNRSLVRRLLGG